MIFDDLLEEKAKIIVPEFKKLFFDALQRQTHEGDLLLVEINGFYNPEVYKWTNIPDKNPYMIGFGKDGHSDMMHQRFINDYRRNNIAKETYPEYLKKFEFSEERIQETRLLEEKESMQIQLQMLIYLKIWESDLFIKRLYQITNLINGEDYDWHFKIKGYNREKEISTGTRETIIRKKVRDRLKSLYPGIASAISNAYKTQIRNAIAHSTYFCVGRHIHLTNYDEGDPSSQIEVLSFDDWNSLFHDTIVLYNQMIGLSIWTDNFYAKVAEKHDLQMQIRVSRKDPEEKIVYTMLTYRPYFHDWH